MRKISHRFQDSLTTMFFRTNEKLAQLSMEYGLF